ncbi:ArdC family protein, partial [Acidithiobacillus albertensis]|uniref:ArdC family protein n=1 Tax=Acidithiobacillus albertensis TaxID=119978 RepID=UPI000B1957F9
MAGEAKTHGGKDKQKKDLRAELAELLLTSIEKNDAWWQKPWDAGEMEMPFNAITGKPYRGVNAENLMMFSPDPGDNRWMTYKQAADAGWQVRKGEHGTTIEKWSDYKPKRTEEEIQRLRDAGAEDITPEKRRNGVKYYKVFHASQIDGIPPKDREQELPGRNNAVDERIPKLAENMGVGVQHSGSRAFYRPVEDRVNMPPIETFQTGRDHDTIFLHELSHSTGHQNRLNRDLSGRFGSQKYAKEELRAELSAAMTALSLGIGFSPDAQKQEEGREVIAGVDNTAAYLTSWLSALPEKDRKKELMSAITDAQKISDYLIERTPELSLEQQQEMPGISRGDYVRFRNAVGQEVEGIVLDNAQPGEATRLRPIDRFPSGAPILGGGDNLVPMVLPDNLVEHIPGAVTPGPDLDAIDPITEAYKQTMGMDDSRNQADQAVLAEVEKARENPERNPRMANIQNLQVGDLIRTREKSLNEQGVFADRERLGIVTHLRTNDDGELSAVASRWIYPYQEGEVPSQDFRGFVMSAGKDDVHQLADLKEQLIEVRKGVVSPDLASDNLQNREIREQFENAVNAYERKIVLEGGEPLISQDNSVKPTPADNDKYFVYEEHTLGFIRQDEAPDFFMSLSGDGGFHLLDSEKANLRPATEADFEKYRVGLPPDFRKTLTLDQLRQDIQEHQNSPEKLEGYLARAVENGYLFSAPMKTDNQVTVKFPHDVSEDGGYQLASFKGESVRTTSFHTLEGAAASFAGIADLNDLKIDRAPEQASTLKKTLTMDAQTLTKSWLDTRFGTDKAMGVIYDETAHEGEGGSIFKDGTDAIACTNYALQVQQALTGHSVRVVGFNVADNPDCAVSKEGWHEGHDFALINNEWLIDPWAKLVEGVREQIVYDLKDPEDLRLAQETYGNPKNWVEVYGPDDSLSMFNPDWDRSGLEKMVEIQLDTDLVAFLQTRHSIRQGEHPDYAGFSDPVANAESFVTRQGRTDPQQATQWAKAIQDNPVEY